MLSRMSCLPVGDRLYVALEFRLSVQARVQFRLKLLTIDVRGRVARRHKAAVEAWYAEMLAEAGVVSALECAREVLLLTEGAAVLIVIDGDRRYTDTVARAAKCLVRKLERGPVSSAATPVTPASRSGRLPRMTVR